MSNGNNKLPFMVFNTVSTFLIFALALFVLPSALEMEISKPAYAQECEEDQSECNEDDQNDSYIDEVNAVCDSLQEDGYDCPNPDQESYSDDAEGGGIDHFNYYWNLCWAFGCNSA